jgi:hypothetical protein
MLLVESEGRDQPRGYTAVPLPLGLDFPRVADEAMRKFREAGMKVVKTTDPLSP